MTKPIIILGQGLAGSVLSMRLFELGKEFLVIDNHRKHSSTEVAAGMWNPIVFRKLNKSWKADELLPELEAFYSSMEEKLGKSILHPLSIRRVHSSKFEADTWLEKKSLAGYKEYLGEEAGVPDRFKEPEYGISKVYKAGYIDLIPFLQGVDEFLSEKDLLKKREVKEDEVLEEFRNHDIIDCRGYRCADSPWWDYLPFGKTKGEVLTIHCPDLELNEIFNAGFFVCPLGDHTYRLGATFNWDEEDDIPTEKGRDELVNKLKKWTDKPFSIIDHRAGIRPTVADRRPLIGRHPEIDGLYLFNGLGTKGVMIAPYLSHLFLKGFFEGNEFPREVNLSRWIKGD
jgi:hypothetical protein